ncbi:MAG: hypothetical protein ACKVS6_16210 [Planctomycetota bacterium]
MNKITKEEYNNDLERLGELQSEMLGSFREFREICNKYKAHGLPINNYDAYVFAQVEIALSSEHGFATRDPNLSDVIVDLEDLESELDFTEASAEVEADD